MKTESKYMMLDLLDAAAKTMWDFVKAGKHVVPNWDKVMKPGDHFTFGFHLPDCEVEYKLRMEVPREDDDGSIVVTEKDKVLLSLPAGARYPKVEMVDYDNQVKISYQVDGKRHFTTIQLARGAYE